MKPTLTISQPCHENWAAMTPTSAGRHCAACQKTVVDFTVLSDQEILDHLQKSRGQTCARAYPEQLTRPLLATPPAPPRWRLWLGALLTLWGLREAASTPVQAQGPAGQCQTPITPRLPAVPATPGAGNILLNELRGVVVNPDAPGQSDKRMQGISVRLPGTSISTFTNADGSFVLALPPGLLAEQVTVEAFHASPFQRGALHTVQQIVDRRQPAFRLELVLGPPPRPLMGLVAPGRGR